MSLSYRGIGWTGHCGWEWEWDWVLGCSIRGAIGGKTGKTVVLPGFCKIEWGSDGAPPYYGGLT